MFHNVVLPKLPRPSTRELAAFLNTQGYTLDHSRKHHVFKNSAGAMVTVPERQEIGTGLLMAILAEIGCSRDDFMKWWQK